MTGAPDLLVVGGGIAGVSLANELARDHHVILLEAEHSLGMHSTGRSAALFTAGYGPDAVQELTRRSEPELLRISALPGMSAVLTARGGMFTAWDERGVAMTEAMLARRPVMTELSTERALGLCPVLRGDEMLLCAYDPEVHDIDVNALHHYYVASLRRSGSEVVTGARVVDVTRAGSRWRVRTADGRIWHGDALVNAAGAWGDELAVLCNATAHGLSPRRRTIVVARSVQPISGAWPVVADAGERWYFKPEGEALLISPGDEDEVRPGDVKPDPLDVALALERVNSATTLQLRSVQTSWAGLRTFAPDGLPVVGFDPAEPTLFSFVGQGGYGIQTAPAMAKVGAELFRTGALADGASTVNGPGIT